MYGLLLIKRVLTSLRAQCLDRHLHECIISISTERAWFDVITKNPSRWEHSYRRLCSSVRCSIDACMSEEDNNQEMMMKRTRTKVPEFPCTHTSRLYMNHTLRCAQNICSHTYLDYGPPHIHHVCKNHDVTIITIDYHVQETCFPLRNQSLSLNVISEHRLCANNI